MKTTCNPLPPLALMLLLATALTASEAPTLRNAEPLEPPVTLELEELWRAGGEDEGVMFGTPVEAIADEQGNVLVADQQLCQVYVFDQSGEMTHTLSREGDGPGEVRGPVDLVRFEDGNFGIAEFFPGKLTKVTPDDVPAGSITINLGGGESGGFTMQTQAEARGGHLVVAGSRSVPKPHILERVHYVAAVDLEGNELARYIEQVSEIQRPHSVVHEDDFIPCITQAVALGRDGRVYLPPERDRYVVNVYNADGTIAHVIERPGFRTWWRNKVDMRRITALFETWAGPNPETYPDFDLKQTERAITALHLDGRDRLWVQHSRSNRDQPDGVFLSLDLYDPDGVWQCEVRLVCEGNPVSDGIRFLGDGRILLIKGFVCARLSCLGAGGASLGEDDAETIEIICYKLPETI